MQVARNSEFDRQYDTLVSSWKRHHDLARSRDFLQMIDARQDLERQRHEMAKVRRNAWIHSI